MPKPRGLHDLYYGPNHKKRRKAYAARVAAGQATCARCGKLIGPDEPWDLGHAEGGGPNAYSGPEHRKCNRGARSGSPGAYLTTPKTSRNW
jgi:hypothetical protein